MNLSPSNVMNLPVILYERDKHTMIIEFKLVSTFNAPPKSFVLSYTRLSETLTTGRRRRSLKYNNKDISYQ